MKEDLRPTVAVKTLLVSDLVDSTRLVAELGDRRAAEVFARHDRMARGLMAEHQGTEIDKTDGFLVLFDRPVLAVRYALAYHQAPAGLAGGIELAARVGIHLGEVLMRRNPPADVERGAKPLEVDGIAKPKTARLMSLARGRQTLITREACELAYEAMADADGALVWLAHGYYLFKGLDEPVRGFEVGRTGFAPLQAPPGSAKAQGLETAAPARVPAPATRRRRLRSASARSAPRPTCGLRRGRHRSVLRARGGTRTRATCRR